jgi:hypothetical protein
LDERISGRENLGLQDREGERERERKGTIKMDK